MFSLFSSKPKSTGSSNKSNEIDVTFHRKRKRETIQPGDSLDGDIEFISEKRPKLEGTVSQSSLLTSFLNNKTVQAMSDWVQHKIPKNFNSMFHWKSKSSKPVLTHGNGQGVHAHKGTVGFQDRREKAETKSFTQTDHVHRREALKAAYRNRGSLPQGSLQAGLPLGLYQSSQPPGSDEGSPRSYGTSQPPGSYSGSQPPGSQQSKAPSGSLSSYLPPDSRPTRAPKGLHSRSEPSGLTESRMVNGGEMDKPLTRPPLHETGSQTPSECGESLAGSSVAGSSIGSRSGLSAMYRQMFNVRPKEKFTADQSVRLQDKVRYRQLLQQFTRVPLPEESSIEPKPETIKDPICPPALPRFYFKSNDSILGSTSNKSLKEAEKPEVTARPRIKVHASQRKTSQRQQSQSGTSQPLVNGDRVEDDSLMYINDISSIHDTRSNNLPGSSKKISIDLTEEDDDDVQVASHISKHKHNKTDYRESKFVTEDWIKDLTTQYNSKARERERQIKEEEIRAKLFDERRKTEDEDLEKRIRRQMHIYKREPAVAEEIFVEEEEEEEEKEEELPELTDDMEMKISGWLRPQPGGQVLIEKFRLQITRNDIATLAGLNWLNDEIINFYMNLLMDRGEKNGNAKVYAFNTFFYPKILGGGQPAVKRWTRKVDIFAHDYILIPVHLGMHWCLAVVAFKKKQVQYYDSMGGNNVQCLNVIKKYLCDECMEKKKQEFNLQGWSTIVIKNIPQQMNGSDCGMFACKYAEYITRGAPITFTQQHMPYFRRRMVYEICTGKLLQ